MGLDSSLWFVCWVAVRCGPIRCCEQRGLVKLEHFSLTSEEAAEGLEAVAGARIAVCRMGSQPSKPGEVKVFQPQTQIDFSEALLAQLESSKESNYSRRQLAERYVEQRVSDRLSELEEDTLKKFENKLESSLLKGDSSDADSSLSSAALEEKIEQLNKKLRLFQDKDNAQSEKFSKNETRVALHKCLLENKGKPLNCYEEIEQFKKLVFS